MLAERTKFSFFFSSMRLSSGESLPLPVLLLALILVLVLASASHLPTLQSKDEWSGVERIVAIGDIHGAYDEFVEILKETKLIDNKLQWIGGDTHLVQTGDVLDRGTGDKKAMDLLMALEEQAGKAGGRVHALIGNHEAMNIIGDLRYVSQATYAAYAGPKSEETRERAYKEYLGYLRDRAKKNNRPSPTPTEEFKQQWLAKHPLGYFEQRSAFDANGKYGRWISNHNAVVKINDIVFLHGGISEAVSANNVRGINERIRQELGNFQQLRNKLVQAGVIKGFFNLDEILEQVKVEADDLKGRKGPEDAQALRELETILSIGGWYISHPDGPLWYRGYSTEPENSFNSTLDKILSNIKARYIVVGHTPIPNGIASKWSGKVFLIDTGMLRSYFRGRCSALVIEQDKFATVYPTNGPCS